MITDRTIKLPALAIFFVLLLISLGVTYLIAEHGIIVGLVVALLSVGVMVLAAVLKDYRIGFYFLFLMGVFMFYIDRMMSIAFPLGTVYDALVGLVFFSVFLDNKRQDWRLFKNPVTIMFVILIVYQV